MSPTISHEVGSSQGPYLPPGWTMRRLKTLLLEPLSYGANEAADSDDPDNPRFVRITDIGDNGGLKPDTFRSLPMPIAKPYLLRKGDLLFARSGATVGKNVLYSRSWGPCCFAGYLIRARTDVKKALPQYVRYFCESSLYWQHIVSTQIQATIQNVSAERYGNLPIPVPDLSRQGAIVRFLNCETSKIDDLIAKQEQLIATLREDRTATITHAVTRGLDPDVAFVRPEGDVLPACPQHWTHRISLKRVATVQTGLTLGRDVDPAEAVSVPYLRVANVQTAAVNLDEVKTVEIFRTELRKYLLRPGDVLMTEGGDIDKLGRGCLWNGEISPCIHQNHVFALRCSDNLASAFLVYLLDTSVARNYFFMTAKKTTNLASTNSTTLGRFSFSLPPRLEQNQIVEFLDERCGKIDALIAKADEVIGTLREYRSALITDAVTGKIDVREAVA
jgi:type I restriction enzyme, S subunit